MTSGDVMAAGLFGKLPTRADFVTRRLPLGQVEPWHAWLAEALAASRVALGEGWLDAYLYGPIWRFAVPAGLAGPGAMVGTLMPSVDRIGRYFPFSIILPLRALASPMGFVRGGEAWFEAAEALSLAALEDEVEPEDLLARVADLPLPGDEAAADTPAQGALADPGIVFSLAADGAPATVAPTRLDPGTSLWWTLGTARIAPVAILAAGLPRPQAFAALLSGRWAEFGWRDDQSILPAKPPSPGESEGATS